MLLNKKKGMTEVMIKETLTAKYASFSEIHCSELKLHVKIDIYG